MSSAAPPAGNGSGGAAPAAGDGALRSCYVIDAGTGQCRLIRISDDPGGAIALVDLGELAVLREVAEQGEAALAQWRGRLAELLSADLAELERRQQPIPAQLSLACSAWYRKVSAEERPAFEAVFAAARDVAQSQQPKLHYTTLELKGEDEARYELAAVTYAASRVLGYTPDIVVSGGKGSSQIAAGGQVASLDLPLVEGAKLVSDTAGMQRWREMVSEAAAATGVSGWPQLPKAARAVAISGFFYGAKAAGLPVGADVTPLTCAGARAALEAKVADGGGSAQDTANWVRMSGVLGSLPLADPDACTIVFAREWIVDGAPFRTTWSSGMFISDRRMLLPA